jgi:glycosyltransferase involved in cell wall biosynthesis
VKIVFINRFFHPDHSATAQLLSDLAFGLARSGMDVHVICSRLLYEPMQGALPGSEQIHGVQVHRVATSALGRSNLAGRALDYATFYPAAVMCLARLLAPGDIAVAMTDPPMLSSAVAGIVRRRGALLLNWLQDVFPEIAECAHVPGVRGPLAATLRRLRNRALAAAHGNVVIGERMARRLIESGAAPPSAVTVVHNWADGSAITPLAHGDNPLRRDWAYGSSFVVGYSGNMGRVHDHETVYGAVRRLRLRGDIRFLLIGGGMRMAELRRRTAEEGLENIRFEPYQPREHLAQSLGAADVHLCSLRPEFEGLVLPSKLYGIFAAGRPTVFVGDTEGEIALIIRREACGVAVAQGDVSGLAAALDELRNHPAKAAAMGARARQLFERCYDLPVALRAWKALLEP